LFIVAPVLIKTEGASAIVMVFIIKLVSLAVFS